MKSSFKPRARLLQLLGEQLIGSSKLAVFELVKNAYDADATEVTVCLNNPANQPDLDEPSITVTDNGCGMTAEVIETIWLEPGTDNRSSSSNRRSKKFNRTHLGEKGVGRFAVHKLGDKIEVYTKAEGHQTYRILIDWQELLKEKYMEDIRIDIDAVADIPEIGSSGTIIKISKLKNTWSKRDVIGLYQNITSIQSPFDVPQDLLGPIQGSFKAHFRVPDHPEWLENLVSIEDVLHHSFYKFDFTVREGAMNYEYAFTPPVALKSKGIEENFIQKSKVRVPVSRPDGGSKVLDESDHIGVGDVHGTFYVFAFDSEISEIIGSDELKKIKPYLRTNGGIRVYRDGVRVYNYGEPGDDWLELDAKRVKHFASGINRALMLGVVNLSLENSPGLVEKTNREGFVEDQAYESLKLITQGAINILTQERHGDKERMRKILRGDEPSVYDPLDPMQKLMTELEGIPGTDKCIEHLEEAQRDVKLIRDTMVESESRGVFISLIYHELEKFIEHFIKAFRNADTLSPEELKNHYEEARRVAEMMNSFKTITKKGSIKRNSLNKTINRTVKLLRSRLKYHNVELISQFSSEAKSEIESVFSVSSLNGALINIIDNALYWLQVRWSKESSKRKIYIGSTDFYDYPAIVIADNGPGFKSDPADLIKAFVSLKPEGIGMGLGLYYTQMVMEIIQGELILENAADLDFVPDGFDGAAVIMVFKDQEE